MAIFVVLSYSHPVEGEIKILHEGGRSRLTCRWPFDLETDEFVELSNSFDETAIADMLSDFWKNGRGRANAVEHGSIEIIRKEADFTIEATNSGRGSMARSLRIGIPLDALARELDIADG